MNKKIIGLSLCIILLFTGCSSADPDIISFQSEKSGKVFLTETSKEELFSSDLCVIDEEKLDTEDAFMSSSASFVINRTKNEVVYAKNVFEKLYPASITKIATALLALKYGNLTDVVTVDYEASHITESGAKLCGFAEGDQIPFETLLHAMLVYSGNDAAMAISNYMYDSEEEYSEKVNQELEKLGATHTHFVNSHGLDDKEHYTTAYDLYLVFNELLNYDEFKEIIKETQTKAEYKTRDGKQVLKYFANTNQYLLGITKAPEGITVLGGKTGTTSMAGNCLILYCQDQVGNEYIALVLNADGKADLYEQMNHLLSKINE